MTDSKELGKGEEHQGGGAGWKKGGEGKKKVKGKRENNEKVRAEGRERSGSIERKWGQRG